MPLLQAQPEELLTDPITQLGTRAKLDADLTALRTDAQHDDRQMLAVFELAGLEGYERKHGPTATSDLWHRLARRLTDAIAGAGVAYRIGHARLAVRARVGRGGSHGLMRACTAALSASDEGCAIVARPQLAMTPIDAVDLSERAENAHGHRIKGYITGTAASSRRQEGGRPRTIADARRAAPPAFRQLPRGAPYMRIVTRFKLSVIVGLIWMGLSAWLSLPWIAQLAASISLPGAIALVAGLALIPGYLNAQLVVSLLLDRPARMDPDWEYASPALTVLVAAYNEQRNVARVLSYVLEQDYPGELTVMLIDDGSGDETAAIAQSVAGLDGRLRVLHVPHGGKAAALDAGLQATTTPLVATIDADTLLMPSALKRIVARMLLSPSDTLAVAGGVMVQNSRDGVVSAAQTWDYLLGIGSIKRQQALLQATLVAQGAFSVYDAAALRAVGGWPDCIGEDIVMTWALLEKGGRTTYEPTAVAFTEVPVTLRQLARQRHRWARGMIEGLRSYGFTLVLRHKTYAHSVIADAMFPYLDFVFTFGFIPGIALALTGNFAIVGPMTLAVLPLNAVIAAIMYHRQRNSLVEAGLQVRPAAAGFVPFFFLYQLFMSPVSVSGYVAELFHLGRRW
jgi:poly-beta-1,6-N-acetyl-D-glucosamine synthase